MFGDAQPRGYNSAESADRRPPHRLDVPDGRVVILRSQRSTLKCPRNTVTRPATPDRSLLWRVAPVPAAERLALALRNGVLDPRRMRQTEHSGDRNRHFTGARWTIISSPSGSPAAHQTS